MATDYRDELSYAAELFGFLPDTFTDDIYNVVYEYTYISLDRCQRFIKKIFPDLITEDEYSTSLENLMEMYNSRIFKSFDKLSQFVKTNIMILPAHVLLDQDSVRYTTADIAALNKSLLTEEEEVSQQLLQLQLENENLLEELKLLEAIEEWESDIDHEQADITKTIEQLQEVESVFTEIDTLTAKIIKEALEHDESEVGQSTSDEFNAQSLYDKRPQHKK